MRSFGNNAEGNMLGSIDWKRENRQELKPHMREAHRKALLTLRNPDYAIQESNFSSVYPETEIRSDMALARRMRSGFDLEMDRDPFKRISKEVADILEAIMLQETELSNWLGENAHTFKTSDYDDFNNKVDMIAEWTVPGEDSRVVGLAVDATYGMESILGKIEQIKAEIDHNRLRSIKYFQDAQGNRNRLRNVPRIVLGVSQPVVEELANLWVKDEKAKLGNHPAQRLLLIEAEYQLRLAAAYARKKGNVTAAAAYENAHAIIAPIELAKRTIPLGEFVNDKVARAITDDAKRLFGEEERKMAA